ncbi:MAG: SpoIID/LytB domain-containing protein [Acidimicrobiales bacterium]|nr:SpoIID/LytB domain-containing protein [Acidimicrobiales bacterium]
MRSLRLRLIAAAAAILLLPFAWSPPVGAADETATITITGRGWGHGRGLGQYGAYGYANEGWSSAQILDHFYGGTVAGAVPTDNMVAPNRVRADLSYNAGQSTTVGLESGNILLRGPGNEDLGYISNGAVRLSHDGSQFLVSYATSCAGPWTLVGGIAQHDYVRLVPDSPAATDSHESMLHVCRSGSARTWYSGEIVAAEHAGTRRTVNVTTIEEYLRGVVPNESPASWPAPALEAQAVAARSYAMAGDTRHLPFADTCETTRCQVFKGRFHQAAGGSIYATTDPRTDAAIAATAGLVRLNSAGRVARTEFSSSTGGFTAGGTFPSVQDDGDATTANPNRQWTKVVDVSSLERKFGKGKLLELVVTARNGLGADGGRVSLIEFRFEQGTVTQTGWVARTTLGLKSDWFTLGPIVRGETEQISNYVDSLAETFLGAKPDAGTRQEWASRVYSDQSRSGLATELAQSDQFAGVMLAQLYQTAFGRPADAAGEAYWRKTLRDGAEIDAIGSYFFASEEYFLTAGGTNSGFVSQLYTDILGRPADAGGLAYWVGLLDSRQASRTAVAANFYYSAESRRDRTILMYTRILGFAPSEASIEYWSARLIAVDDIGLAVELASTDRYFNQAQTRG